MRERRKVILERSPESQGQRTSTQRGGQVAPRRRKAPHCREDLGSSAAEVGKKAMDNCYAQRRRVDHAEPQRIHQT